MKVFKTLSSTILFLFAVMTMTAQSKVAHIDSQALISSMPEVKEAQVQLAVGVSHGTQHQCSWCQVV